MDLVAEPAPAKVNLTLQVRDRRADGYHHLESFVVFADVADRLEFARAADFSLDITGPFAADVPADGDNLVLTAARALAHGCSALPPGAAITLDKRLPAAAGIGGGSADAAATLRGLLRLYEVALSETALQQIASGIGADVTVCLHPGAAFMSGVGNVVSPAPPLPAVHAVLANPGVALATADVFAALGLAPGERMPCAPAERPPARFHDVGALAAWLAATGNDLEAPAVRLAPMISEVVAALRGCKGCLLARMSGSGPTCFGLFDTAGDAQAAAMRITAAEPAWWIEATRLS